MEVLHSISSENEIGFKALFDYATVGILVIGSDGKIKLANPCIEKLFNYLIPELIGNPIEMLLPEAFKEKHIHERNNYFQNPKVRPMGYGLHLQARKKDGFEFPAEISLAHYPFGREELAVAFVTDITKIRRAHEELEAKVTERTLELSYSLEHEKELNELKSRFVTIASHEFRTPLSAILSSISLIESYDKEEQKEQRNKHIERIKSCVKNLVDILNDFLSLEKLEQGKIELLKEKFDIYEFATDIVVEINVLLKLGQQIIFKHIGDKEIIQDKIILKNIILNLLSNAIKYSDQHSKIAFIIDVKNTVFSISIQDEGIGIPKNEQKNLYGKFYRASNANNIQGTGLGLNIVKKYVTLLDGQIRLVSSCNKGTTFTITLPKK